MKSEEGRGKSEEGKVKREEGEGKEEMKEKKQENLRSFCWLLIYPVDGGIME